MEQTRTDASPTPIESWPAPVEDAAAAVQPRTGEPRRPATIVAASITSLAGMVIAIFGLLWSYWTAVGSFSQASPLFSWFATPEVGIEVILAVVLTLVVLAVVVLMGITGYYAWWGYDWTRNAAIIAAAASGLLLIAHPFGWVAILTAFASAVLTWLPTSRAFFAAWRTRRHPDPSFSAPVGAVRYGPLSRYRRN